MYYQTIPHQRSNNTMSTPLTNKKVTTTGRLKKTEKQWESSLPHGRRHMEGWGETQVEPSQRYQDLKRKLQAMISATTTTNNNNNSELYLHDYNNTALQKRRKHHNYSNLTIRVQFQLWYIYVITFIQYFNKGQINLFLISKHDEMNMINQRLT